MVIASFYELLAVVDVQDVPTESRSYLQDWVYWVFGGGVVSLMLGAIGGGLSAFSVTVPKLDAISRALLMLVGVGLLTFGGMKGFGVEAPDGGLTANSTESGDDAGDSVTVRAKPGEDLSELRIRVDGKLVKIRPGQKTFKAPPGAQVKVTKGIGGRVFEETLTPLKRGG